MLKRFLQREINTFPISPMIISKLANAGFIVVSDFNAVTPLHLSAEAHISEAEARDVLSIMIGSSQTSVQGSAALIVKSALDLLHKEQETGHIVTFCESLDDILGAGVPLGKITEICGAPGLGKTQMCLQLAVDAHIPVEIGGLDGEAVYIDTEGSFIVERLVDIATATVDHCQLIKMQDGGELGSVDITVEKILAGIHYFHCQDHTEFLACMHQLSTFLNQHQKVKLVVVDSIACPFRLEFSDMSLRTKLLSMMAQCFIKLASQNSIAVVFTNQMSTRIPTEPGNHSSHLIPALGESWAHTSNLKVQLSWENGQRKAVLSKSPNRDEQSCFFQITAAGIRDVKYNDSTDPQSQGITQNEFIFGTGASSLGSNVIKNITPTPPAKRQKVSS